MIKTCCVGGTLYIEATMYKFSENMWNYAVIEITVPTQIKYVYNAIMQKCDRQNRWLE